jgi:hypothetical protein
LTEINRRCASYWTEQFKVATITNRCNQQEQLRNKKGNRMKFEKRATGSPEDMGETHLKKFAAPG